MPTSIRKSGTAAYAAIASTVNDEILRNQEQTRLIPLAAGFACVSLNSEKISVQSIFGFVTRRQKLMSVPAYLITLKGFKSRSILQFSQTTD